jgi:tRNA(Ile)-lysidine synthase
LSKLQKKYAPAKVVTAHHQDDLVETIVMNLIRGTGWRGLAPMRTNLERPLLGLSKVELVEYALKNRLDWVEDQTNYGSQYFRNRVRNFLLKMTPEQRQNLLVLGARQQLLREQIEKTLERIHQPETIQVKSLLDLPPKLALEVLRTWTQQKLTTPQLKSLLKKLTTAKTGDLIQPGGKIQIGVYKGQLTITELSTP